MAISIGATGGITVMGRTPDSRTAPGCLVACAPVAPRSCRTSPRRARTGPIRARPCSSGSWGGPASDVARDRDRRSTGGDHRPAEGTRHQDQGAAQLRHAAPRGLPQGAAHHADGPALPYAAQHSCLIIPGDGNHSSLRQFVTKRKDMALGLVAAFIHRAATKGTDLTRRENRLRTGGTFAALQAVSLFLCSP